MQIPDNEKVALDQSTSEEVKSMWAWLKSRVKRMLTNAASVENGCNGSISSSIEMTESEIKTALVKTALLSIGDKIWCYDKNSEKFTIEVCSGTGAISQYSVSVNEAIDCVSCLVHPDDQAQVNISCKSFIRMDARNIAIEFRVGYVRNEWRWVSLSGTWIPEHAKACGVVRDADEKRRLAELDELTGLGNRRAYNLNLEAKLNRASANSALSLTNSNLVVIYLDLDKFKQVNDTLGHQYGDKTLKETALRISTVLEGMGQAFRIGGDEFAIVLWSECGELNSIHVGNLCQRLLDEIKKPIFHDGIPIVMTASIGIARFPQDGSTGTDLEQAADSAMYQAKRDGRNTFRLYKKGIINNERESFYLESALRRALPLGSLSCYFSQRYYSVTAVLWEERP
ncbi:diguanylate cyclase domain-containing protein [Ideonella paludis]|uniref:diguanylate cyclase domain-containing protein n=1 Tax=Ideonella paludis TaxID=1233411 RepID=UPI003626F582